jgi:cellulose synthase/poly-beta-1,6-N-acetylglucosamine synthase-like glycosyltransferase
MKHNQSIQDFVAGTDTLTQAYRTAHEQDCAWQTFSKRQIIFYFAMSLLLLLLLKFRWDLFLFMVIIATAFWYFSAALFRISACFFSLCGNGERRINAAEVAALNDADLPLFTILLPLYREANIADKIIRNIEALDYPKNKLDVKLLLESNDAETQNALRHCRLPDYFETVIIPDTMPRTKPRACNYGLAKAQGEFCVIFDAEDRPEPDQLKKAVIFFRCAPPELICVQAKLNYYNSRQNLLTRLFTIEYSTTFDLLLAGMQKFHLPLPLGGTSNHFRTAALRELGGWDPFNVTEDCDLGIRIYKRGWRTGLLDSTTWEEANSQWGNWLRQRSRWVKGFLQTHLSHTRHCFRTWRQLGFKGFFGFYLSVGAGAAMMLINPLFWLIGLIYLVLFGHALASGIPASVIIAGPHHYADYSGVPLAGMRLEAWPLYYWGPDESQFWAVLSVVFCSVSAVLLLSNLFFVGIHALACLHRRRYDLIPFALLMPFYWIMISCGAWRGFFQLFSNPFYWEKTIHGLDITNDGRVPDTVNTKIKECYDNEN